MDEASEDHAERARQSPALCKPERMQGAREIVLRQSYVMVYRVHGDERSQGDDQLLAIARSEVDLVACRQRQVLPDGWEFAPLRDDRLAVLCRAGHAAARLKRGCWRDLADYTWLLTPAGTAARECFEALSAVFPEPPGVHSVITRSPTALNWLLLREEVLALVPINVVRPLVHSGQIREGDVQPASPMAPLGMLRPAGSRTDATRLLSSFLQEECSES